MQASPAHDPSIPHGYGTTQVSQGVLDTDCAVLIQQVNALARQIATIARQIDTLGGHGDAPPQRDDVAS